MKRQQIDNLKYPYSYKGVTNIFISEVLEIILSVVTTVLLFLMTDLFDDSSTGFPFAPVLISVLGIMIVVIYLIGLVQARKEEKEFRLALIMTIIIIVLELIAEIFLFSNPKVGEWVDFACEILQLIAFESVVTGIVTLAKHIGDEKIVSMGKKMRILVTLIWIAVIAGKALEFISDDVSENVKFAGEILHVIDHVFYMILLVKGRSMLKLAKKTTTLNSH